MDRHNYSEYLDYLAKKRKGKDYMRNCEAIFNMLEEKRGDLTELVKSRWSGYVSQDKNTFKILNDYAAFCEKSDPIFFNEYNDFISRIFEGEARKAMKAYKDTMVFIPCGVKINPDYLNGLTNEEYVAAFKAFQEFLYMVYDSIEHGSPFDWGWPDWNGITHYGIVHNRVLIALNALVECGHAENGVLIVDKQRLTDHALKKADEQIICKPIANTWMLLNKLAQLGMSIEALDNDECPHFFISLPSNPDMITVLCSYFKPRDDGTFKHIQYFSYRFVEDPATQTHETFFLAKTDGELEHLREIYYWLYDEAVMHGFVPTGEEKIFCYLYKKGSKEWLLLGKGSSYHEEEFLHSIHYSIAVKVQFIKTFHTHTEQIADLEKRFPKAFAADWGGCHGCKSPCKNRVKFNQDNHFRCLKCYFYFHDPSLDDVKLMLELYKTENKINRHQ